MPIPNQGWLPEPINSEVTQITLPEPHICYYYVCNVGPYDPHQPWEKPVIEWIAINQHVAVGSGWKNGVWGWFVAIVNFFAYGDALIDSVWPPLDPSIIDESCPGEDSVITEVCPPALALIGEVFTETNVALDDRIAVGVTEDSFKHTTFLDEACPGSRTGEGCE